MIQLYHILLLASISISYNNISLHLLIDNCISFTGQYIKNHAFCHELALPHGKATLHLKLPACCMQLSTVYTYQPLITGRLG